MRLTYCPSGGRGKMIFLSAMPLRLASGGYAILLAAVFLWTCTVAVALAASEKTITARIVHTGERPIFLAAGDESGHVVGIGKRQGQAVFKDNSRAKFENVYTFDAWRGRKTIVWSNIKLTFTDGSWLFIKNTTVSLPDAKGRLIGKGKGSIIKGGGRFKGARGTFETIASKAQPSDQLPQGARLVKAKISYTLP